MSNIDEQFVEYIVKSLVGNPDAVSIKRTIDDKGVLLELTVDPDDLGRVIGKRGATAQSLRTLLRALGTKNDARYNLKIVDNGPEDYVRPQRDDQPGKATDNTSVESEAPTDASNNDDQAADEQSDEPTNDVVSKTRKELEEFDDLDL